MKNNIIYIASIALFFACQQKPTSATHKVMSAADSVKGYDSIKAQMAILAKQPGDTILPSNYIDRNGLREGHWLITNEVKHLPGYGYKDKIEEGYYYYGKKEGWWKEYYPGNMIKNTCFYKGDSEVIKPSL